MIAMCVDAPPLLMRIRHQDTVFCSFFPKTTHCFLAYFSLNVYFKTCFKRLQSVLERHKVCTQVCMIPLAPFTTPLFAKSCTVFQFTKACTCKCHHFSFNQTTTGIYMYSITRFIVTSKS